jgi:hypothetical protein
MLTIMIVLHFVVGIFFTFYYEKILSTNEDSFEFTNIDRIKLSLLGYFHLPVFIFLFFAGWLEDDYL